MTPRERTRLAAYRKAKAGASLVLLVGVLTLVALAVLAGVSPDLVFRSPLMVFAIPALVVIIWLRNAPRQWVAAGRDIRQNAVDTLTGHAIIRERRRPGLRAGADLILLAGGRQFVIQPDIADKLVPGSEISVRFAPLSGALLSACPSGVSPAPATPPADLNRRERELLALIAEGLTDKQIARRLNLSPATVRTYNSALYARLGVTSRTQAIRAATEPD